MLVWASIAVLVLIAAIVYLQRARIASLQAGLAGGTIGPGCVVAQAAGVLLIALLIWIGHATGML